MPGKLRDGAYTKDTTGTMVHAEAEKVHASTATGDGAASRLPFSTSPGVRQLLQSSEKAEWPMYNKGHSNNRVLHTGFSGIDTVRLWLQDFTVADNSAFEIRTTSTASTGETDDTLLYEVSDGVVYGGKAYLNTDLFGCTLHSPEALFVQASLPKQLHRDNRAEASGIDIGLALTALEGALWRAGISTDIREARISRLDIARTVHLDRPVSAYAGAIRSLTYPRMDRTSYYSGGARWSNSRHQISFYDKGLEQTGTPSNECRLEYRLIRGESIARYTPFEKAGDLTASTATADLDGVYYTATSTLLDMDTTAMNTDSSTTGHDALLEALVRDDVHGATSVMQQVIWLATATEEEREAALRAIQHHKTRQEAYRVRKKWDKLQKYADLYAKESTSRTVLWRELKEHFVQDQ